MVVTGLIVGVDRDKAFMHAASREILASLDDLPDEVLDRISVRDLFAAECKFERYGSGYFFKKDCKEIR